MKYTQSDAKQFTIPGGISGFIYPDHPQGEQTIAVVEQDGVYPEAGYSVNNTCTESIFMLEGEFKVEVDGQEHVLLPGDLLMILPGQKYRLEGRGKSVDIITPSWDKKQNHIVDN